MADAIDATDLILAWPFTLASLVQANIIGNLDLNYVNFGLNEVWDTIAGIDIRYGVLISAGVLLLVGLINRPDISGMQDEEKYILGIGIAAWLAMILIDPVRSFVTGNVLAGIAVVTAQIGAYYSISFNGVTL